MNNEVSNIINAFIKSLKEYARTILIAFLIAVIFTTLLTIHARNEMIKNIYANENERKRIDEIIARQLVAQSDMIQTLANKNYAVCMQVGNLYETAHDYNNAEYAYKLASVLIAQGKYEEAEKLIDSVPDENNIELINFKTKAYKNMGDKYYSDGKFLSAAKNYEKAKFYYERFEKGDKNVVESLRARLVKSYIDAADIIVKNGYNTDAVRFLKKAEHYAPDNHTIKYKLAIIYSDLDPVQAVEYFEHLLSKMPQYIDYESYNRALMKAANIADLEGQSTKAKYYRYKIHSLDLFVYNKVVYKEDIEPMMVSFTIKHFFFRYNLKTKFRFKNVSNSDILKLSADFVLKQGQNVKETVNINCLEKGKPLYSNGNDTKDLEVRFHKKVLTRKELESYTIDIYLYKDEKYKTLVATYKLPQKSFDQTKD